jgi:hypothetical protein
MNKQVFEDRDRENDKEIVPVFEPKDFNLLYKPLVVE